MGSGVEPQMSMHLITEKGWEVLPNGVWDEAPAANAFRHEKKVLASWLIGPGEQSQHFVTKRDISEALSMGPMINALDHKIRVWKAELLWSRVKPQWSKSSVMRQAVSINVVCWSEAPDANAFCGGLTLVGSGVEPVQCYIYTEL